MAFQPAALELGSVLDDLAGNTALAGQDARARSRSWGRCDDRYDGTSGGQEHPIGGGLRIPGCDLSLVRAWIRHPGTSYAV